MEPRFPADLDTFTEPDVGLIPRPRTVGPEPAQEPLAIDEAPEGED